jgi:hypothetical protein
MLFVNKPKADSFYIEAMPQLARKDSCRKEVIERYLKATGQKKLPKNYSLHHADWDRSNDSIHNEIIAKDDVQHNKWHRQLMNWVSKCVNSGLLKFDLSKLQYFTDDKYIIDKISKLNQLHAA